MEEARLIDLCSYVPSIDEKADYNLQAERLYNKTPDQWQRSLDRDRQEKIGQFWRTKPLGANDSHGHIVNNVVLSYSPTGDLNLDEENSLLNLGGWFADICAHCNEAILTTLNALDEEERAHITKELNKAEEEIEGATLFAELCPDKDCPGHKSSSGINGKARPFEIIDGQHRTRGLNHEKNADWENSESYGQCKIGTHQTIEECEEEDCEWIPRVSPTREPIPFSITVFENDEPDMAAKAKLFVDINTRAEDLSPNHKITMLWRHRVPDGKINDQKWRNADDLDFSQYNKFEYRIYLLILEMIRDGNSTKFDQTNGMIPPLAVKSWENNNNQISVREMREWLRDWMEVGRVFGGYTAHTTAEQFARVFNNYLSAWAWWLSGPVSEDDELNQSFNDINDKRYWAPSHQSYEEGNPIFDHDETPATAKTKVTSPRNGFIQHVQNNDPNKGQGPLAKKGELNMSPAYRLIYYLFEPITVTILQRAYEEESEEDADPWQAAFLQNTYSPISAGGSRTTENIYRQEIEKFVRKDDQMNYEFGQEPLTQNTLNNRAETAARIICAKLGWNWRG